MKAYYRNGVGTVHYISRVPRQLLHISRMCFSPNARLETLTTSLVWLLRRETHRIWPSYNVDVDRSCVYPVLTLQTGAGQKRSFSIREETMKKQVERVYESGPEGIVLFDIDFSKRRWQLVIEPVNEKSLLSVTSCNYKLHACIGGKITRAAHRGTGRKLSRRSVNF